MKPSEIVAGAEYARGEEVRRVLRLDDLKYEHVRVYGDGQRVVAKDEDMAAWEKARAEVQTEHLGWTMKRRPVGGTVVCRGEKGDMEMPREEFAAWAERRVF